MAQSKATCTRSIDVRDVFGNHRQSSGTSILALDKNKGLLGVWNTFHKERNTFGTVRFARVSRLFHNFRYLIPQLSYFECTCTKF